MPTTRISARGPMTAAQAADWLDALRAQVLGVLAAGGAVYVERAEDHEPVEPAGDAYGAGPRDWTWEGTTWTVCVGRPAERKDAERFRTMLGGADPAAVFVVGDAP